jgi:hypothetical protein
VQTAQRKLKLLLINIQDHLILTEQAGNISSSKLQFKVDINSNCKATIQWMCMCLPVIPSQHSSKMILNSSSNYR